MKAIRARCLDCCCGQYKEVELCPCWDCSLYPYRLGKNPNIKLTDDQRAERAARLKKTPSQQGEKMGLASETGKDTSQAPDSEKGGE